jgi:phytoene synthase
MDVSAAYRHCEEITWSQARNFSYGIRLLPPAKRRALAAVYAFARRVDDIGDGTLPPEQKLTALQEARVSVTELAAGAPAGPAAEDPVLVALADAGRRFPIPLVAFGELIEGCEADVRGTSYATFEDLRHYCRCVAGSIGRLSLGVFGTPDMATAEPLADALGVALQLTNILRDIREDYGTGRVYLPTEDLDRFGCTLKPDGPLQLNGTLLANEAQPPNGTQPQNGTQHQNGTLQPHQPGDLVADPKLVDLVMFEVERARSWYALGLRLLPLLDRRSAACTAAMAGIYFRLLGNIAAAPEAVLQRRVSLSASQKAMVAAKSLAGTALRTGRPGPSQSSTTAGAPR